MQDGICIFAFEKLTRNQEQWKASLGKWGDLGLGFATDGERVLFGVDLGMTRPGRHWAAALEAPLGPDGKFIPGKLVEIYKNT
jgi:hypothetical protein